MSIKTLVGFKKIWNGANKRSFFLLTGLGLAILVFVLGVRQPVPFRVAEVVGKPDIYRDADAAWMTLREGDLVYAKDKIRTVANSDARLSLGDRLTLKLERSSQFKGSGSAFFDLRPAFEGHLFIGGLLGATDHKFGSRGLLTISTPNAEIRVRDAIFRVQADVRTGVDTIYVLRGRVEVERREGRFEGMRIVRDLEKIIVRKKVLTQPVKMEPKEWQLAFEAYRMIPSAKGFQLFQQWLSKRAGSLFQYVRDHGDFYTPRHGFIRREFFFDRESQHTLLRIYYDVFPETAFVGFYMLTRDLDLSKTQYLEFDLKSETEASPEILYMEFKSRGEIVRSFPIQDITKEWKSYHVPVRMGANVRVDEVVIYLRHSMAQKYKQGTLLLRNLNLVLVQEAAK